MDLRKTSGIFLPKLTPTTEKIVLVMPIMKNAGKYMYDRQCDGNVTSCIPANNSGNNPIKHTGITNAVAVPTAQRILIF